MRPPPILTVEKFRIRDGQLATSRYDGNNGAFLLMHQGQQLGVIVSDGLGWDHVSVSLKRRCPTWEEMCHVKNLWFEEEECVVQFHPPRSVYRNHNAFCLHLWRPQEGVIPLPPPIMVAPSGDWRQDLHETHDLVQKLLKLA